MQLSKHDMLHMDYVSMRRRLRSYGQMWEVNKAKEEDGKVERNAPSTRKFRVALGRVIVVPCMSFVTLIWQPRRELKKEGEVSLEGRRGKEVQTNQSVRPNARSSMSC